MNRQGNGRSLGGRMPGISKLGSVGSDVSIVKALYDEAAELHKPFRSTFAEWEALAPEPGSWHAYAEHFAADEGRALGTYQYVAHGTASNGERLQHSVVLPIVRGDWIGEPKSLPFRTYADAVSELSSINPAFSRITDQVRGTFRTGIPSSDHRARAMVLSMDPDPAAQRFLLGEREAAVLTKSGETHPLRIDGPMHELLADRPFGSTPVDAEASVGQIVRSTTNLLAIRGHGSVTDLWDANRLLVERGGVR